MTRITLISKPKETFDETKPYSSAELTQEMADLINLRLKRVKEDIINKRCIATIFSAVPTSGNSKNNKSLFKEEITKALDLQDDFSFLEASSNKELEVEVIFFLAQDYVSRDVDNLLKTLLDSLKGLWYKDDGQIKKIIAEKYLAKDIKPEVNPKIYEQIYCCLRII